VIRHCARVAAPETPAALVENHPLMHAVPLAIEQRQSDTAKTRWTSCGPVGSTFATRMWPGCPLSASIIATCSAVTPLCCRNRSPAENCARCAILRSQAMTNAESNFRSRCYQTPFLGAHARPNRSSLSSTSTSTSTSTSPTLRCTASKEARFLHGYYDGQPRGGGVANGPIAASAPRGQGGIDPRRGQPRSS
jgi:hypothetical protein